jgi:hypothetical protein
MQPPETPQGELPKLDQATVAQIPESVAREFGIIAIGTEGAALTIVSKTPLEESDLGKLPFILNRPILEVSSHPSISVDQVRKNLERLFEHHYNVPEALLGEGTLLGTD